MKHIPVITSVLSKVELPKKVLEDVINHRLRNNKYNKGVNGMDEHNISPEYENIQTLSTQVPAKGNLQISISNQISGRIEKLEIPVQSCFLVTCIKGNNCTYKVGSVMSLS